MPDAGPPEQGAPSGANGPSSSSGDPQNLASVPPAANGIGNVSFQMPPSGLMSPQAMMQMQSFGMGATQPLLAGNGFAAMDPSLFMNANASSFGSNVTPASFAPLMPIPGLQGGMNMGMNVGMGVPAGWVPPSANEWSTGLPSIPQPRVSQTEKFTPTKTALGEVFQSKPPHNIQLIRRNAGISAVLKNQDWNRITVCHTDGSYFWVHEETQSGDLATMEMMMGTVYEGQIQDTFPDGFEFETGTLCGAPYYSETEAGEAEVTWTRAEIINIVSPDSVEVLHVDYGSHDIVEISKIRLLKAQFTVQPAQAIKCHLADMAPFGEENETLSAKLCSLLVGQFFCKVSSFDQSTATFNIKMFNDSLESIMPGLLVLFPAKQKQTENNANVAVDTKPKSEPAPAKVVKQPVSQPAPAKVVKPPTKDPEPAPEPAKSTGPVWGSKNSAVLAPPTAAQQAAAATSKAKTTLKGNTTKVKPSVKETQKQDSLGGDVPFRDCDGFVFHCANSTQNECTEKLLFGLPKKFISHMGVIKPALDGEEHPTVLFLYNVQSQTLLGTFEAASEIGVNIDPEAWKGSVKFGPKKGSPFPAQVRVKKSRQYKNIKAPKTIFHIGTMNNEDKDKAVECLMKGVAYN